MTPVLSALLCAAPAAWLTMIVTTPVLVALLDTSGAGGNWDEFLLVTVLSMSLPLALIIVTVYLPVAVVLRRASFRSPSGSGGKEPSVGPSALAGMLSAPVAGFLMLAVGHVLYGRPDSSLADVLLRLAQPEMRGVFGIVIALMLGGAVFGGGFAWATKAFPPSTARPLFAHDSEQ